MSSNIFFLYFYILVIYILKASHLVQRQTLGDLQVDLNLSFGHPCCIGSFPLSLHLSIVSAPRSRIETFVLEGDSLSNMLLSIRARLYKTVPQFETSGGSTAGFLSYTEVDCIHLRFLS